jgi:hypothetical protein
MARRGSQRGEVLPVIPDHHIWAAMTLLEELELQILQNFEDSRKPTRHLDALKDIVKLSVMHTRYAGDSALEDIMERAETQDFKDKPGEFQRLLLGRIQKEFGHLRDELSKKLVEKVSDMRSGVRAL